MRKLTLAAGLLGTTFCLGAEAQQDLFFYAGLNAGQRFGACVAGGADVNGDGVADALVGAPYDVTNGVNAGAAYVRSGATGALLFSFHGDSSGDLFGSAVALGDLDGDGRAEVIVGAYGDDAGGTDAGTVYVYSGLDGSLVRTLVGAKGQHQGFALAFVPDANGDGTGDVLVGARAADFSATNAGCARLYAGLDGALLQEVHGEVAYDLFGSAVAGLDDVDGDGRGDLLVGSYLSDFSGPGAGSAYVYSGATGNMLYALRGQAAGDAFGYALADAGDVNGDGRSDLLVGAPSADGAGQNTGRVNLYSGANGALLASYFGDAAGDNFGCALAGDLRLDADGVPDFVVGVPAADVGGTSAGLVRLVSGADGHVIADVHGAGAGARLGASVARLGDTDLDGRSELLLGAWGEDAGAGAFSGVVHVLSFSSAPVLVSNYCTAGINSDGFGALMSHLGTTSVAANDFELVATGVPAGEPGLFFYGSTQVQDPFGDGFRCVGGGIFRLNIVAADAGGQAALAVDLANPREEAGRILPGSSWNFQVWYRDGGSTNSGFNLSDGLAATFVM
ncbi:MAG: FG-GAP repeat protein [Planctomycetes bacterium]|nr:FG-GAP repeat protein [Planctomycetota bacterium]